VEIVFKKVNELIPYINNTRTHNDEQVQQIASSIKEFGFTNAILLDEKNGVIAGHGRIMAAKMLNMDEVPTVTLSGLTDAQIKAYIIADNKLALNAGWDEELLKVEIEGLYAEGFDITMLGFTDEELIDLDIDFDGNLSLELDEDKADEVPELVENPVIKRGDLIELGMNFQHRLLCGDSTSDEDVDKLLNGTKIDLIFTDPPYNVAFNGRSGKHDVIKNDNLSDSDFQKFINGTIRMIKRVNADQYYIWCNWKFYGILQEALDYKSCIVWAKNVFGIGNGYRHQHEFCLYNGKIDEEIKNESDLWEVKKDHAYIHPTQKPVALSERGIGNHRKAINILDLFGGSGSTLIGCENLNRNAFINELDEKYVQLIIQRYCDYTSIDTIKINGEEVSWSEHKDANQEA
jgi:site-specific DNA-methyltransferase (adenine-specific)